LAKPAAPIEVLRDEFGPHPKWTPPGGWQYESEHGAEKLVKTHCCFCGQQCGIQLKVRDNTVIGFEPWEEFPFNRGMLCPKGVKRYLQGAHPDRLLHPLMRGGAGFRQASWEEALEFTARRLREIQERYGKDAVAVYGGASLITGGCAWSRRERPTSWPSMWIAVSFRGAIFRRPKWRLSLGPISATALPLQRTISGAAAIGAGG
jgi:assimilatory nitrate reductase catalytic subunit